MTRLAYIISAYKYPQQLVRLVERLNVGSASFFIHVDRKTKEDVYRQMVGGLDRFPNVRLLKRHRCDWGGFGHVAATLEGIATLVSTDTSCDYVILLTGQDYPIKPIAFIERYFSEQKGRLFLEYFGVPHPEWQGQGRDRIEAWHVRLFGRHYVLDPRGRLPIRRRFPSGLQVFGGSSYWCLTRECIQYVHTFATTHPRFVNYFRYVDVPDEMFFQTIVLNSPFKDAAVNDNLRYIEWNDPASGSPAVLGISDFQKLQASPHLFARKFDMQVDGQVLDQIDKTLLADDAETAAAT